MVYALDAHALSASKAIMAITHGLPLATTDDGTLAYTYPRELEPSLSRIADRHRKLTGWYVSRDLDCADRDWLAAISRAITLTVAGAIGPMSRPDLAQCEVMRLCASVNEADLAVRVLIPLIERGLPDDLGPERSLRIYADFLEMAYPPE